MGLPELPDVCFSVAQRIARDMLRSMDFCSPGSEETATAQTVINQGYGTPKQSIDLGGSVDLSLLTPDQVIQRLAQIRAEREALEEGDA